ncbi:UDP-N-acetylmuramate dehydrogenase [Psychromicrobium xiongbiense]|uniref:UDP-N-acetylmuramate dehydrogenase n=1 Tax=Psychromicrobium xiongbiense TaxID=3051184 RepID=UPI002557ADB8|nr:UDP-N-acetylmuramate dehydrogenase [Psychromicrobium sp. YIM S02556]
MSLEPTLESHEVIPLAELTTLGVGGPARHLVRATSEAEIIEAVRAADDAGERLLILGGGSNVVVGDAGFDGIAVQIASQGYAVSTDSSADGSGAVSVVVQAGENWDDFVHQSVLHGWSGLEALSGIPGSSGATPVQNVGAYGTDVAATIAAVRTWDRQEQVVRTFTHDDCEFGYRDSRFKRSILRGAPRFVVLTVEFRLALGQMSAPVRYSELAARLGVDVGQRAPALEVRGAVLALRASKGMLLNPTDRDSHSTGSFFTNPVVSLAQAQRLPEDAPRFPVRVVDPLAAGSPADEQVKLSAAWLISHAGFDRGFGAELTGGRATLSTKHSLAVTNRGGATAQDVLILARAVQRGVQERFGVLLEPESQLVGIDW